MRLHVIIVATRWSNYIRLAMYPSKPVATLQMSGWPLHLWLLITRASCYREWGSTGVCWWLWGVQLLCTWDCLLSGSPQSQREDNDKSGSQPFAGSMSKASTGSQLFAGIWADAKRVMVYVELCVASVFMCLELWVDRGRSPHQSHVGRVAPALLPTPFIPHACMAAIVQQRQLVNIYMSIKFWNLLYDYYSLLHVSTFFYLGATCHLSEVSLCGFSSIFAHHLALSWQYKELPDMSIAYGHEPEPDTESDSDPFAMLWGSLFLRLCNVSNWEPAWHLHVN